MSESKINLARPPSARLLALALTASLVLLAGACGGDDDSGEAGTATPGASDVAESPSPEPGTPAPPDPMLATERFDEFVAYVQEEDLESAWSVYIASVPGDLASHNATLGCEYAIFADELPRMRNMFDRITPYTVQETFGAAAGSLQIEIRLLGQDENEYLATLIRDPASAPYRIRFFNNGRPSSQPGVPEPFPSPEDPRGFCGIWTGPR